MKIRNSLSIKFALIVASILTLFSISVYFSSANYRESEFYERLNNKAFSTAKLLIGVKEIDNVLLKIIDENTTPLYEENVVVFDANNKELYNSAKDSSELISFSHKEIEAIRKEKEKNFKKEKKEFVGLLYEEDNQKFVVIASAIDLYGYSKLENLKFILIIGFIISVLMAGFAGWMYAGEALKPISNVIQQVDNITINNMDSRVSQGNGTDEIAMLAITFNKMLERLDDAFQMQKSFVSNASHELRTPLTAITGEIEVTLLKKRSEEEYEKVLNSILEEVENLSKLSSGLLQLAQTNIDISRIKKEKLRIDDLIWQVQGGLIKRKKEYTINILFDENLEDENKLMLYGNEQLLRITLLNLMDNGCKFSDNHTVNINIGHNFNSIKLVFSDNGMGISKSDILHITEPFYRAENARNIKGHGIGLSLVDKIIRLHNGKLEISSELGKGTIITATLPFFENKF